MTSAANTGLSLRANSMRAKLLYGMHRVLQKLSGGRAALHTYLFCAQPVAAGLGPALRPDPHSVVRHVGPADPLLASLPRPAAAIALRFASGHQCHAISVKGEFGGCIWIARGHYDEDEVRCRYLLADPERCVWDFDVYVAPPFRHGRTMGRLWQAVGAALAAEQVAWTCSRISLYNLPSVQSHERLGARLLLTGCFLVLGRLQLALLSAAPYVALSLHDGQAPVLRLGAPKQ
jgi:hypothetical protein